MKLLNNYVVFLLIGLMWIPSIAFADGNGYVNVQEPTDEALATPSEVLVIYNTNITTQSDSGICGTTQDSLCLANYYKNLRNIPDSNVLGIAAPHISGSIKEVISRDEYNTMIKAPVETYLNTATSSGGSLLKDTIKYIVTVKGVPLKIAPAPTDAGEFSFDGTHTNSSVDAALCLLFRTYDLNGVVYNPFWNVDKEFSGRYRFKQNTFSRVNWDDSNVTLSYLVTRLDGYTVADVKSEIDRAINADQGRNKYFVLDESSNHWGDRANLNTLLQSYGFNTVYDNGSSWISSTSIPTKLIAYVSDGANTGGNPMPRTLHSTVLATTSYENGAISSTYESYNGRCLNTYCSSGHSSISDFIAAGGTGGFGYVYEPFLGGVAQEKIWMPSYALGYTWADAAYMSVASLDWQVIVIGDPLMRINNAPFPVSLLSPATNTVFYQRDIDFVWATSTSNYLIDHHELYVNDIKVADIASTTNRHNSSFSGGSYEWFVRSVDKNGGSTDSNKRLFSIDENIQPYSLIFPENYSIVASTSPVFIWDKPVSYNDINHYELYMDNVMLVDNIATTSTTSPVSLSVSPHTWFVKAIDSSGQIATSTKEFNFIINPFARNFLPVSPADNSTLNTPTLTFSWSDASSIFGIDHYDLYVDGVRKKQGISGTSTVLDVPLPTGRHLWFIRAIDTDGNTATTQNFVLNLVDDGTVWAPTVVSPISQTITKNTPITFMWSSIQNSWRNTHYVINVTGPESFSRELQASSTQTSFGTCGDYLWNVYSKDVVTNATSSLSSGSFTITNCRISGGGGGGGNTVGRAAPLNKMSVQELQAIVADLTSQLALLLKQKNLTATYQPNSPYSFTKDLQLGDVDTQVKQLQKYLNYKGFTVAVFGLGSMGFETTYFGPATKKALQKFQIANKITPATGYFGPKTRNLIK